MEKDTKQITEEQLSGYVFKLYNQEKLQRWVKDFSIHDLKEFINSFGKPGFGQRGHYAHFCKKCGGSWSFESKADKYTFRSFHMVSGCDIKIEYDKEKHTNITKRVTGSCVNTHALTELNKILTDRQEAEVEKTKTDVPDEPKT